MHKRPRSLTLDEYARIHRPDLTAAQAAELLGVSARTIVRHRARLGLSQASAGGANRPTPELLAKIAASLDDGWPVREVERTYGTTWRTVVRHFPGRSWNRSQVGQYARMAGKS
ncbi:helix-turn-helix DNA binding domain protein [Arthrobacter phage TaylorSipht]|nr:helix-turn-helix DNA binding domain protein [Arthrobacter phage TaylorSipht]